MTLEEKKTPVRYQVLVWAALAAACCTAGRAATTMWLSTDAAGAPIPADILTVQPGARVHLHCYMDSSEVGNTVEVMVGYDTSDAPAGVYGAGADSSDGVRKKLVLSSGKLDIEASVSEIFDVFRDTGFAGSQVVVDASGREESNPGLGKPYGFVVRAARYESSAPGAVRVFSFELTNRMTAPGDEEYVVISGRTGANSYSSAWKHGASLGDGAYALRVVNGSGVARPVVGAANRVVLDSIVSAAAADYIWVFWGLIDSIDEQAGTFDIDDGSGVVIHVRASPGDITASGLHNGSYAAVKGTLEADTRTVTSLEITKY